MKAPPITRLIKQTEGDGRGMRHIWEGGRPRRRWDKNNKTSINEISRQDGGRESSGSEQ